MMTYPVRFPSLPVADLEPWRADALCTQLVRSGDAEPHWWFPTTPRCPNAIAAVEICRRCPVAADCLAWANRVKEHDGIWGGQNVWQRTRSPRIREWAPETRQCIECGITFQVQRVGAGSLPQTCSNSCKYRRTRERHRQNSAATRARLQGVR